MSRKLPHHDYSLRSMSNLLGERRKKASDDGERSLITGAGASSLSSPGTVSSSSASISSAAATASGAGGGTAGDPERAARKQLQRDDTPGFVYLLAAFSALGGFLLGYDTGVLSGAVLLLKRESSVTLLWQELLVSGSVAAAALSALAGGSLNGLLGRRVCVLLASCVFALGGVVLSAAPGKEVLLVGRLLVGLGLGKKTLCPSFHIHGLLFLIQKAKTARLKSVDSVEFRIS